MGGPFQLWRSYALISYRAASVLIAHRRGFSAPQILCRSLEVKPVNNSPRSTRRLAHATQPIHKAWSAFPTAIVSRQLANYFPGKGGTRMGGFFHIEKNHPANAEFYQIESIMGANGRQIYPYAEPDIRI